MSNDTQKVDQIAHKFYTKLCLVVNHARATAEPQAQSKVDKWVSQEFHYALSVLNIIASSTWKLQMLTYTRSPPVSIAPFLPRSRHHRFSFKFFYAFQS